MPEIISGMSGITDVNKEMLVIDVSKKIWDLKRSIAPFNILLQKLPKRRVDSIEYRLFEDERLPDWDAVKTGYDTIIDTIEPVNITIFQAGDIVMNTKTQERMYVISVGATELTVKRAWGYEEGPPEKGFPAVEGLAGEKLLNISNALPEKAEKGGVSKITKKEMLFNRVQKISTVIELSNEELKHKMYGEDRRSYEHKRMGEQQIEKIEKNFWLQAGEYIDEMVDGVSKRIATTDGVLSILHKAAKKNVIYGAGAMTEEMWDKESMPLIFKYGNKDNKWCFASMMLVSLISSWAKDKLMVDDQRSKEYGLEIWTYKSPAGILKMILHPAFENDYEDLSVVLDMDCVEYVYFADEDNKLTLNLQNKEKEIVGGIRDLYFAHCGLFLANSLHHTVIRLNEIAP